MKRSDGDEFRVGDIDQVVIRRVARFEDPRGWLCELYREDELDAAAMPVMAYASATLPGVARGPHEHRDQTDCLGMVGPGRVRLFLWDARPSSPTFGHRTVLEAGDHAPTTVVIPPGVVHAYRCIGDEPAIVFNAPNRLYGGSGKAETIDEIRHEERDDSPFILDDGATD